MSPGRPIPSVDLDRLEKLMWLLSALGLLMVVLGVVGEYRGWWNDVGEALISFGTVASVATGVIALLINSTKGQVSRVADGVESNGDKLDRIGASHGEKLDQVVEQSESNGQKLDRIETNHGEKLDHVIEATQTTNEHLENQHDVLVQIRDRL